MVLLYSLPTELTQSVKNLIFLALESRLDDYQVEIIVCLSPRLTDETSFT